MANHIKRVKTISGNEQIDYTALANLPSSDTSLSIEGGFADAYIVGNEIDYLENVKADVITKSADGTFIFLTDSANAKLQEMHIMGKTEKTGANLNNITPVVYSQGGNLLSYPYNNSTLTQYGITFTDNGDGSISISGTATGEANFILYNGSVINGANYLYGCESDGSYCLVASDGSNAGQVVNTIGYSSTQDIDVKQVYITVESGVTVNATIRPMLSYDQIDYEPYKNVVSWDLFDGELRGIPVTENGNYIDENGQMWICDEIDCADTKHIQRIGVIESYTGQSINTSYISSGNGLETGATVYYILSKPVKTDLTQFGMLKTYHHVSTIQSNTYIFIVYAVDTKSYIEQNYVSRELFNDLVARVEKLEA